MFKKRDPVITAKPTGTHEDENKRIDEAILKGEESSKKEALYSLKSTIPHFQKEAQTPLPPNPAPKPLIPAQTKNQHPTSSQKPIPTSISIPTPKPTPTPNPDPHPHHHSHPHPHHNQKTPKNDAQSLKKIWIIGGTVLIILIIILLISSFSKPLVERKLQPLDVVVSNATGLNANIFYKDERLITLSGWESKLTSQNEEDRLFGKESYKEIVFDDNGTAYTVISSSSSVIIEKLTTNPEKVTKVGWFTNPNQVKITNAKEKNHKYVHVLLDNNKSEVTNANLTYTFFEGQPFFKVSVDIDTTNPGAQGDFAYGVLMQGYDIYLKNGTILYNDNQVTTESDHFDIILRINNTETTNISSDLITSVTQKLDIKREPTTRNGSLYLVDGETSDYEIFMSSETNKAVILYTENTNRFVNSFYWNVFWTYVSPFDDGSYPPLYVMVLEDPAFLYESEYDALKVASKTYTGYVDDYINDVVYGIELGDY